MAVYSLARAETSASAYLGAQQRWLRALGVSAVLGSLAAVALVLPFEFAPVVALGAAVGLGVIAWRPRWGLYAAFALVVLFEDNIRFDPLMQPGLVLYQGVASRAGVIVTPLELLLLVTFLAWLGQRVAARGFDLRGGHLAWPMAGFVLTLVAGLVRGALGGGDLDIALWEARYLFYLGLCYPVAADTLRTIRHIRVLTTLLLVSAILFAVDAIARLPLISSSGTAMEFAYGHESVLFLGAALMLGFAQGTVGGPRWQRRFALIAAPIILAGMLVMQRRAGYAGPMVALLAFSVVLLVAQRRTFVRVVLPLLLVGAVYLPLFWTNTSPLGQPARAVRSLVSPDPRDAASNLYRALEKVDVRATIVANPLLGVGFGRQFEFVVPLPDLSFWRFWHYEPHANILWVWLKTGAVGFIVFWILIGGAIARAAHFARRLREPELRSFALLCLGVLVSFMTFCYVDQGLVEGRLTVVLGILLGALSVLDRVRTGGESAQ